jgi:hypothetical protein
MLSEQIKSETDPRKKDQIKSSLTRLVLRDFKKETIF